MARKRLFSFVLFILLIQGVSPADLMAARNKVKSFSLVNTDSKRVVSGFNKLTDGAQIELALLPENIALRIQTRPRRIKKIHYAFTTPKSTKEETVKFKKGKRKYISFNGSVGNYTISASTPRNRRNPTTSFFSIIDSRPSSPISAVWANSGEDKVTRDELRVSKGSDRAITNTIWDGSSISLQGAKNEVVSFNIILESADGVARNVSVAFNKLSGPNDALITSKSVTGDEVFDYNGRNIELFYVRYLQIKGLSLISYDDYDERHIPERLRRPFNQDGEGTGRWQARPDHDKFYPDIAVPIEAIGDFNVETSRSQSIWVDIYIPKDAAPGTYTGEVKILQNGAAAFSLPVSLKVFSFTLPDNPSSKTMLYLGYEDINNRYLGDGSPANQSERSTERTVRDRHFQMAHRHKISLIDSNPRSAGADQPHSQWITRLDGSLFTEANGYDGPGKGKGNGVFSIGTYGDWSWRGESESSMRTHSDAWVDWFESNSPETEFFLYLIDESSNYKRINKWAGWLNNNPGSGSRLMSFATLALPLAVSKTPELDIAVGWLVAGARDSWQSAVDTLNNASDKIPFMYNGFRPGSGTFAIEDDGVSLRELSWGQYKKKISRWFFWESTYYNNYQGSAGETNVFKRAQTFGEFSKTSRVIGETGWNYSNGDGVLFYPGTDEVYPSESYGLGGPIASLRLKHWRRGIQDVDYLKLAAEIDPESVNNIVDEMVPKALWEYGVTDPSDPTWVAADISWSTDPDDWESARTRLAAIIEGG